MSSEVTTNDSQSTDYLLSTETLNISANVSQDVIVFDSVEIYSICVPFLLSMAANVAIVTSIVRNANTTRLTVRRGDKYPVIDLILLILSITAIARLAVRSGLQIFCFSGNHLLEMI